MKFLYVPWRSKYVKNARVKKNSEGSEEECIFCQNLKEDADEKNFILGRYKFNFIMLNLYPYNTGHLMVLPLRHVKDLNEMTIEERQEFIELVTKSSEIVQAQLKADALNIGANLGKAAGAGIPSHFHMHIIPRWNGDTNFLPIIAGTKTISLDLNKVYTNLKAQFKNI